MKWFVKKYSCYKYFSKVINVFIKFSEWQNTFNIQNVNCYNVKSFILTCNL